MSSSESCGVAIQPESSGKKPLMKEDCFRQSSFALLERYEIQRAKALISRAAASLCALCTRNLRRNPAPDTAQEPPNRASPTVATDRPAGLGPSEEQMLGGGRSLSPQGGAEPLACSLLLPHLLARQPLFDWQLNRSVLQRVPGGGSDTRDFGS